MSILSVCVYISIKYTLRIVNLILQSNKILYMSCGFCYFYFLNLMHENYTHIIF